MQLATNAPAHTLTRAHATQDTLAQTSAPLATHASNLVIPQFVCPLSAGFPSPAAGYMEEALDLNAFLVRNKAATFVFSVKGQSMMGAGILDGDKVLVDRAVEPKHGHIVVAVVNDEYTIKRLHTVAGRVELHAENPAFAPRRFKEGEHLEIWGVVAGVIRRYAC
jgi:DNA polymerase V